MSEEVLLASAIYSSFAVCAHSGVAKGACEAQLIALVQPHALAPALEDAMRLGLPHDSRHKDSSEVKRVWQRAAEVGGEGAAPGCGERVWHAVTCV